MGFLERIENLIQGAIEGGTSSVLRNKLTPIEIENHLERAMRDHTQGSRGGRIAPTSYTVWLHPDTYRETIAGVEGYNRHCEMLLNQLAATHGYTLLHQRIAVAFDADGSLGRREVRVQTAFAAPPSAPPVRPVAQANTTHTQVFAAAPVTSSWSLTVTQGTTAGQRYALPEGESRIGRAADNDIVLDDGRNTVSRSHAIIVCQGNDVRLRDNGSTNGTKVNGNYVPAYPETFVTHGAEITMGECMLRLTRDDSRGGW